MLKASAASGLVVAALLSATFVVVACSSSDNSEFPGDPPKPDAEPDGPGSFLPDAGGKDGEAGVMTCTAKTPSPFTPTWKPPVSSPAACTAQELTDYYAACLANAGTTEPDGTCAKFKADHAPCAACTEPADQGGPIQWQAMRKFYTLNVAGCIALKQADLDAGAAGCGEAYNAAIDCARQSCIACITEANSFTLFQSCQADAKAKDCKTYETAKVAACGSYSGAADCFPKGSEPQELMGTGLSVSFYTRVIGVTCGTP